MTTELPDVSMTAWNAILNAWNDILNAFIREEITDIYLVEIKHSDNPEEISITRIKSLDSYESDSAGHPTTPFLPYSNLIHKLTAGLLRNFKKIQVR